MPFDFFEQGAHAAIRHDGQEILRLDRNVMFFRGVFHVRDQVMVPGGRPEIASVPVFSAYHSPFSVTDVRYRVATAPDELTLTITPTATESGAAMLSEWIEEDVIRVRLQDGRFVWTQQATLQCFRDVDLDSPEQPILVYRTHHADGRPSRFWQYADPQPAYASGPAVPMARDWLEQYEPYAGPDNYRSQWKRAYVGIVFQDPDGSFARSNLNKTKWHNLTLDNRRARPCHPKGLLYVLKESGEALEYRCDAPSHYHHVCEWGMDFHFWCDLDPFLRGSVLPAGTRIVGTTTSRFVGPDVTRPVVADARPIELTALERRNADRPAYEEPENTFMVSALDRMDAQVWQPASEGCSWQRSGGHAPGAGCLVIRNDYSAIGEWRQASLGPSQWGNPFIPGARYRLSAWVRVDDFQPDPSQSAGPQVGVEFTQYNGPAASSAATIVDGGWSPSLVTVFRPLPTRIDWTRIELLATCPSYVLNATLKLRLHGRGTVYFSGVRWELASGA